MLAWIVVLFALLGGPQTAHAQKRVALVIGNSAYENTAKLANPANDASDVADVLKAHAFQVLEGYDLSKAAIDAKLREFARALSANEVGLFFYAGHGLQVSGTNYLVPVDARLEDASGLDFELVRLDLVQRTMEREAGTNIIFLDACRDNPLARNLARAFGTRSVEIGRGLAPTQSGAGTLISFSTQPGNVALDGKGRNSPFAGALVKRLVAAKDDISAILIDVRNDVMKATQDRQVPWEHSALRGRFYIGISSLGEQPAPQLVDPGAERAARDFELTAKVGTREAWDAFLIAYPTGFYAELAKVQRAKAGQLQRPSTPQRDDKTGTPPSLQREKSKAKTAQDLCVEKNWPTYMAMLRQNSGEEAVRANRNNPYARQRMRETWCAPGGPGYR
ncbi:MAG: caspase domain-containing protein [Hyphomicrobiaceae bacterium]